MKWFGVRTFYRTRATGRPRRPDQHYVAGLTVLEERVVLFRARSGAAALRKARREGERYADHTVTNLYGQSVVTELLSHAEAYELDGDPDDGAEIFSAMEGAGSESAGALLRRKTGPELDPATGRMFIAADIAARIFDGSLAVTAGPRTRPSPRPRRRS